MLTKKSLKMQEYKCLQDYNEYRLSFTEFFICLLKSFGIIFLFSYIFYRSWIAALFLIPITYLIFKDSKKELTEKRKIQLSYEFKEMMNSLIAGLQAGYSVENSFEHAYRDMVLLLGKHALIVSELSYITKALKNNRNIEALLSDLAKRSHVDDIRDFAEVFSIAKRSGGDLPAMLRNTADIITEKMDMRRKLTTLISSKKFEQNIMNVIPFAIILYIDMSSPGFFNSLYGNMVGIILMTVLLIVYLVAYFLAKKITDIKI